MRAAVIQSNKVINIIIAQDSEFATLAVVLKATLVNVDNVDCGIGYTYDGTTFTSPVTEQDYIDALTDLGVNTSDES